MTAASDALRLHSVTVDDTARVGRALATALPATGAPFIIHLRGDLGAGKTTLARSVLQALGVEGPVKSPTYTLLEPYRAAQRSLVHLDLYRVREVAELEGLALRDYYEPRSVWLVEWPERGVGVLPPADLEVEIEFGVQVRYISLSAKSATAQPIVAALRAQLADRR